MNANIYTEILKQYELLNVEEVIPIAHIRIKPDIGILLDNNGNFIGATLVKERHSVPCTIDSESRTSGIAPHPIHDNMSYVCGDYGKYSDRHEAYIEQLKNYTEKANDEFANSVYRYLIKNTIRNDVDNLLQEVSVPEEKAMIVFATPGHTDTINREWKKHYINSLDKDDFCPITGEPDYIPDKYAKGIIGQSDMSKLFMSTEKTLNSMPVLSPGYISSQKILHTLQYMMYEGDNYAYSILRDNIEILPEKWKKKVKNYYKIK